MAQMPFSPCEASDVSNCADESFKMLQYVFGDMVSALAEGADPNTVNAVNNILATMFGFFNSGLLIVGGILVSYVAVMGVVNTANDGEAMGKDWSSVWTSSRIVTGAAMLLPTTSGYSFIQLFVMLVTLWGVGLSNGVYKTGMAIAAITPDGLVASASVPGQYYGLDGFANDYVKSAYCQRATNAIYADSGVSMAKFSRTQMVDGARTTITEIKDSNSNSNLAGGRPICGVIMLSEYIAQPKDQEIERVMEELKASSQAIKLKHAKVLMTDIEAWVATWPTSIEADGWTEVKSNKLNEIVKKADSAIVKEIAEGMRSGTSDVDNSMNAVLDKLVEGGWASAGGWYQRVGAVRVALQKATTMPVGDGGSVDFSGLPSDDRADLLDKTVNLASSVVVTSAQKQSQRASNVADVAGLMPDDMKSLDVKSLQKDLDSKMNSVMNTFMRNIVGFATGVPDYGDSLVGGAAAATDDFLMSGCGMNGQLGGSLHRMKCLGDYIVTYDVAFSALKFSVNTVVSAVRFAGALVSSGKFLGTGADLGPAGVVLRDWVQDGIISQITTLQSYLKPLGFYFSVALPSLPFGIFLIVVVGWLLGVLQAMIGAPLWAVMMMTPSRTFIGSQQQGLLLFLTIFLRPALAILGLFAAMLISDPIIDFISKGFFDYRGAIVGSSGIVGWFAEFFTFANWIIAYAFILGPVLYMTYGLPQALPDVALSWIGAGVKPLGETSAIAEGRNASGKITGGGGSGGGGGGGNREALANRSGSSTGNDTGGGTPKSPSGLPGGALAAGQPQKPISNEQGVTPSAATDSPTQAAQNNGGGTVNNGPVMGGQGVGGGVAKDSAGNPATFAPQRVVTPNSVANSLGRVIGGAAVAVASLPIGLDKAGGHLAKTASAAKNQLFYGQDDKPAPTANPAYQAPVAQVEAGGGDQQQATADISAPEFEANPRGGQNKDKPV